MNEYLLVQNLMYDIRHVKKKLWWHSLFGNPSLTVDSVQAVNENTARKKFKLKGHKTGFEFNT